jgi:hypothetical protein
MRLRSGLSGALALGLLYGCGKLFEESCDVPCPIPIASVAGFPRVEREPVTLRVVSTLHVGETVTICAFADCSCNPVARVDWQSTNPAVARVTSPSVPLSVCNDAYEHSRGGGALWAGELVGVSPGITNISGTAIGFNGNQLGVGEAVYCATPESGCMDINFVRVVP